MTIDEQQPEAESSKPRRVFLHIGFHKTGTSALQNYLFDNRAALEQKRISYPTPLCGLSSHLEIGASLFPDAIDWIDRAYNRDETFRTCRDSVISAGPSSITIFSTEELCRIDGNRDLLTYVFRAFRDFDTKIVAYRRDPVDFLLSLYHHNIRATAYCDSFGNYLKTVIDPRVAEFNRRLKGWIEVFGRDNVLVRDYDAAMSRSEYPGIVRDFFRTIGEEPPIEPDDRKINVGVHPWLREAYCGVKKSDLPKKEKDTLHRRFLNVGNELPRIDAAQFYLGEEKARELRRRFTT